MIAGGEVTAVALPDLGCYECDERLKGFMLIVRCPVRTDGLRGVTQLW